jgi:hypothetical protein
MLLAPALFQVVYLVSVSMGVLTFLIVIALRVYFFVER